MQPISVQIAQLSVTEQIQLVEDIWNNIAAQPDQVAVTSAQLDEIDRRLEDYAQTPEKGSQWEDVRLRLGGSQ